MLKLSDTDVRKGVVYLFIYMNEKEVPIDPTFTINLQQLLGSICYLLKPTPAGYHLVHTKVVAFKYSCVKDDNLINRFRLPKMDYLATRCADFMSSTSSLIPFS